MPILTVPHSTPHCQPARPLLPRHTLKIGFRRQTLYNGHTSGQRMHFGTTLTSYHYFTKTLLLNFIYNVSEIDIKIYLGAAWLSYTCLPSMATTSISQLQPSCRSIIYAYLFRLLRILRLISWCHILYWLPKKSPKRQFYLSLPLYRRTSSKLQFELLSFLSVITTAR
jgi:hypothetical protein